MLEAVIVPTLDKLPKLLRFTVFPFIVTVDAIAPSVNVPVPTLSELLHIDVMFDKFPKLDIFTEFMLMV